MPAYSAEKYDAAYVENLWRGMVHHNPAARLTMLVDEHYQCVEADRVVPLSGEDCGGWSKMLEIFRPDLWPAENERHVLVGLDSIITGDCSWLFDSSLPPIGLPLDPYAKRKGQCCDAVVSFDREGARLVWEEYQRTRPGGMREYRYRGLPSEMILLKTMVEGRGWPPLEEKARRLLSFKQHVHVERKNWQRSSIVYFHGKPKPAEIQGIHPDLYSQWAGWPERIKDAS